MPLEGALRLPVSRRLLRRIGLRVPKSAGRPHRVGPEPPGDPVHRLLRFPPARRAVVERQLPRGARGRPQARRRGRRPAAAAPGHPARTPRTARTRSRRSPWPRRSARRASVDLVMVLKLASRSFTVTVRATHPAARSARAVRPDSRSSSRRITSGSSTSVGNVSSAPTLFSSRRGVTRRSSLPQASAHRCAPPATPSSRRKVACGTCAISPTVRRPSRPRTSSARSPTPHSALTGSGCRKSSSPSAGTTSRPSGLQRADAILATNLTGATPTEQVMRLLLADLRPDQLRDRPRRAQPALRAGHVEERLVERERLHFRGDRAEDGHDLLGHLRRRARAAAG